jgi:outer membrane protein TolC
MNARIYSGERRRVLSSLFIALCSGALFAQQTQQTPQASASLGAAARSAPTAASPIASSSGPASVSLDDCLAAAKLGAPSLKTAELTLDNAAAQLAVDLGANGLKLGESAGYFHEGNLPGYVSPSVSTASAGGSGVVGENVQAGLSLSGPSTSLGVSALQGIAAGGTQSTALSVSGSQVVYDGYPGGRPAGISSQAQYSYRIAQVAYGAALKSLAYQVKQAYYTLLGDQDSLVADQATFKQAQEELAQMQGYLAAGRATKLDVLQVQVAAKQAQLNVVSAQNSIESDMKKLSLAVGWPLEKRYAVAEVPTPARPQVDLKEALDTAFVNRPELKTFDLNLEYAGVDLSLQKSQYAPSVSVNGSLGFASAWTAPSTGSGVFTAGVSVALPPIYDGKQQASRVRQKMDQIDSYKVQRDQERQSISIDVQNALFAVQDSSDRLDLSKQNLEQAQGVYDLEKEKFALGSAAVLDVMTAFSTLATAQAGLEQAKSTFNLAILNLYNVMGL